MNIETALEKLFSLHTFGIKLGLENVKNFLDHLGNPQQNLRAFHLAGSNGKGSTAAFIASILREFKYKVGLYTSPHFVKYNERIRVDDYLIPDEYVAKFLSKYFDYIDEHELTFFEVTTAIAFNYFSDEKVDYAVIETGLGGRLDATNVLNPVAVILTSLSLEHTNILGSTLRQIAYEKASIIKQNLKVFTGILPDEGYEVVEKKCKETNSNLFKLSDYTNIRNDGLELYTEELEIDNLETPLKGSFQKYNAALAALVVSKTIISDNFKAIEHGFKNVIKNTGIQGRYEYNCSNPVVIFDSAHNTDGIKKFLSEFNRESGNFKKKVLLFGVMKDKSISEMLNLLKDQFDEIHITEIGYERSAKVAELKKLAGELGISVLPEENPVEFIKKFKSKERDDCLVVLGSMYLLGEIKTSL